MEETWKETGVIIYSDCILIRVQQKARFFIHKIIFIRNLVDSLLQE